MRDGLTDHVAHVYRLALRLTGNVHRAEDLTQETFLRAWQRIPQLKDDKATKSWLFRIAVNLANDGFRKRDSAVEAQQLPDGAAGSSKSPDQLLATKDELEHALKLLDMLPTQQRVVLYLVAVEELSLGEVCDILEINMNAAKANLSLGRKRMRDELARTEKM